MSLRVYAKLTSSRLIYFLTKGSKRPKYWNIQFPGDYMPGVPPVPIPNTAVKPRAADGSRTLGPARVGCCQVYSPEEAKAFSGLLRFIVPLPALPVRLQMEQAR